MTRDEAVAEIAARLGNRTELDAKIILNMGYTQQFILERLPLLPWFLITEHLYADTTVDEPKLSHPVGFLREVEQGALWRQRDQATPSDAPWQELEKMPHDKLRSSLGGEIAATGAPNHYSIFGSYWTLGPVPDAVYRIYTRIYRKDTLPSAFANGMATNAWLTNEAELVIAETTLRLARHLQWTRQILPEFRFDRDEARRNYFVTQEARDHANIHYQQGVTPGV